MGGNLIQHVVKEAYAGVNFAAAFAIQPHLHVNLRLFGLAFDVGIAVAFGQPIANGAPVKRLAIVAQAGDAHVFGQGHVCHPIANHIAVGFIQRLVSEVALHQLDLRLTAVALVGGQVRTDQHLVKDHALGGEDLHHQIVRAGKVLLREAGRAQPILVGDHDQLKACGL